MQIEQTRWVQGTDWVPAPPGKLGANAQLVFLFGSPACLKQTEWQAEHSLTFAGDMPQGGHARLMKANFDRLIDRAVGAAQTSFEAIGNTTSELALLISCVGRKLVLKQRIEEEGEEVREVLRQETVLAGFYSYGEISPFNPYARCELHNQTMPITTLSEF